MTYANQHGADGSVTIKGDKKYSGVIESGYAARVTVPDGDTIYLLHPKLNIQRLLNNANWRGAAEAAIAFFLRGEGCKVDSFRTSSTWKQVEAAFECLWQGACKAAERAAAADSAVVVASLGYYVSLAALRLSYLVRQRSNGLHRFFPED